MHVSSQYVIYARRSSDSEDKQTLSISSQIEELRKLAVERGIEIRSVYQEDSSAREPGRPVFGELMKRVDAGEVSGILCWRLDRLARNMVDGGEIIYLLSKGRLKKNVTPEATYTGTPDSKFMLAMLFGAAAKYTDDLSSAVKRGNRAVYKEGRITGRAPIGYLKVREKAGRRGASPIERTRSASTWSGASGTRFSPASRRLPPGGELGTPGSRSRAPIVHWRDRLPSPRCTTSSETPSTLAGSSATARATPANTRQWSPEKNSIAFRT